MVVVAVAGGTSGLGRNVVEAIFEGKKHHPIVLSREPKPDTTARGIEVRTVDWESHESVVKALQGVHTLISCIGIGAVGAQLAMIKAAQEVGVKRWAPSEFAHGTWDGLDMYQHLKGPVWQATVASNLEYCEFVNGLFLNPLATGTPKGEKEALDGYRPENFIINAKDGTADYPGDGNVPIPFMTFHDIGRFVAASLDLEHWPKRLSVRGDVKTYRQLVQILEKAQNRKFLERENSVQELKALADGSDNMFMKFYHQSRTSIATTDKINIEPQLNEMFPDIKITTAEEFLNKWWGGVTDLGEPHWGAGPWPEN